MFATGEAKAVWALVPVFSLGLLAPLPFLVATAKGVLRPVVPVVYGVLTVVLLSLIIATDAIASGGNPVGAILLAALMATAATHTAFLDAEVVRFGRR
jgi:hypothetical protein